MTTDYNRGWNDAAEHIADKLALDSVQFAAGRADTSQLFSMGATTAFADASRMARNLKRPDHAPQPSAELSGTELLWAVVRKRWPDAYITTLGGNWRLWVDDNPMAWGATEAEALRAAAEKVLADAGYTIETAGYDFQWKHVAPGLTRSSGFWRSRAAAFESACRDYLRTEPSAAAEPVASASSEMDWQTRYEQEHWARVELRKELGEAACDLQAADAKVGQLTARIATIEADGIRKDQMWRDEMEKVRVLREALAGIINDTQEWCDAVSEDASWDGWDSHYKALKWGGLEHYRAALAQTEHRAPEAKEEA